MTTALEKQIDSRIGEVRTEALDLSFGELVNLHNNAELVIQPEYQRLFRWSEEQRSRLIESILLELPIPQIFVIENQDGVLELIDGLQRISSVIQFINPSILEMEPLKLQGCDIIHELNGKDFNDLSLSLKLRIKRSSVRTIVIKKQSKSFLRYEMFKRLNTGGAFLSPQEIRNCSARMLGEHGTVFYSFLQNMAKHPAFVECTDTLPQADFDKKGNEELVLRFFATKNGRDLFKGSVRDWLDDYMEGVLLEEIQFNYDQEGNAFESLFDFINETLGEGAFVKYRGTHPVGALAPAYYEAITAGFLKNFDEIIDFDKEEIKSKMVETVQSATFRDFTGPGANSRGKLERRIATIENALKELTA